MTIQVPENRKEISNRIKSDIKGQLPKSNPYLRVSFLQALIFGLAGRLFDLYKLAKTILREIFWDTATGEFLERPAAWFGISKSAATGSTGKATVEGTPGTAIPINTLFQSSDGNEYQTTVAASIIANSLTVTISQVLGVATVVTSSDHGLAPGIEFIISGAVETEYNGTFKVVSVLSATSFTYDIDSGASTPATGTILCEYDTASLEMDSTEPEKGDETNLDEGAELTISSLIAGVNDTAFAQFEGFQGGTNTESTESLRDRFLFRVQNPVALFNEASIEIEAKRINGVTRVFIFGIDKTVGNLTATSLTNADQVAIFATSAAHGLNSGQKITVSGANQAEYNVISVKIIVLDATRFAYTISGSPSTATGTPIAAHSLVEEGQVKVFFTRDNDDSIIPSTTEVDDVKDQILTIKPAHVSDSDVIVKAPTSKIVNFSFSNITPNTSTMQAAVLNQLTAFFQEGPTIGVDILETQYNTAIANTVDPNTGNRLESFTLSTPPGNIPVAKEEIGVLGDVTF